MSFGFIRDHAGRWPIRLMCRVLKVSASGYRAWRNRPDRARAVANRALHADVRRLHAEHPSRYGSPGMHAALRAEGGMTTPGSELKPRTADSFPLRPFQGLALRPYQSHDCLTKIPPARLQSQSRRWPAPLGGPVQVQCMVGLAAMVDGGAAGHDMAAGSGGL
jgi:hypothetical protein